MVRRKGQLSRSRIDREWPHQVALRAFYEGQYGKQAEIAAFCAGLSVAPLGPSVRRDDEWYRVHCFACLRDAERFRERFGGEWFNPADRGAGRSWMNWVGSRDL
jgi:hypothetical protein